MKATKILKGITKFEEFDFNTLKLYRKDGFCTLAKKEDLSFLYYVCMKHNTLTPSNYLLGVSLLC